MPHAPDPTGPARSVHSERLRLELDHLADAGAPERTPAAEVAPPSRLAAGREARVDGEEAPP